MIREALTGLKVPGFLRSVGVLVSGTALSAAIAGVALPVLTRLYTPADFSVLAVFTSVVSIISVAACLRFDVAIPMPAQDSDAANVVALALLCTLAVSVMLSVAVMTVPDWLMLSINQPSLKPYLWLMPPAVMLAGSYSIFQFWFVRKKEFATISGVRVAQACVSAGSQIAYGWFAAAPFGLIVGQLLNNAAGCLGLGYRIVKADTDLLSAISWSRMRFLFAAYDQFPKYSTFEALSNSAGIQLPIIMIGSLAVGPEAGFLLLAMYAMQAPMGLIGNAIAQVYLSRAPEEFRLERLGAFTALVFGGLVKSGAGPLIFAGIVAPELFTAVFGEGWRRAGILASWMTPWFVMQFLAVPISMALHVTNNQKSAFILQLIGLFLRVGAVYGASVLAPGFISEAYAISGFLFYLAYAAFVFTAVHARVTNVATELIRGLPIVLLWTTAGAGIVLVLDAVRRTM